VVRDLLTGYVPGGWLKQADFSTLVRVGASYVSEDEKERHDDTVWRVKIGGRWLWVYIIVEFQGKSSPWMALRMTEYMTQLAWQIIRENKKGGLPEGRIPPILPVVLYNGEPKWNAAVNVADCFVEPPDGLEAFLPRFRYLLLDEKRLKLNPAREVRNFAEAVFRMESGQTKEEVFAVIKALAEVLRAPEMEPLRRAFHVWTTGLLKRRTKDTRIIKEIDGIDDIFEERAMAETIYWDEIIFKKGEKKGERKGEKKGAANMLVRLLTRRFGQLPTWAEARLRKAKSAQLEEWSDKVLDAKTLADVLGEPEQR